jgi:WD40 repeat protein
VILGLFVTQVSRAAPPVTAMAIAPDDSTVAIGSQAGISILSLPDLAVVKTLPTQLTHVHDWVYSADGKTLIAAGGVPAESGSVEVWRMPDGRFERCMTIHEDVVYRVALSSDSQCLATASGDGSCQLLSLVNGEPKRKFLGHSTSVLAIAMMPDAETIASAGADHTIRIWRRDDAETLRTLSNHVATVTQIAIVPSLQPQDQLARMASISDDRTVRIWQPLIGRLVRFTRFASVPTAMTWSPDGEFLWVTCRDGTLWTAEADNLENKRKIAEGLGRVFELAVMRDGKSLLAAGEFGVKRIELR